MKRLWSILACAAILQGCASRSSEGETIACVEDMKGHSAVAILGSVQETLAREIAGSENVRTVANESDGLLAVKSGKADGTVMPAVTWNFIAAEFPELYCVCDTLNGIPFSMVFPKKADSYRDRFNEFVGEYIASGEYAEMVEGWSRPGSSRKMPEFDHSSDKKIVADVDCQTLPFSMVKDGVVSGIEPELITRFAHSLGMGVEFNIAEVAAIIAAATTGKADIGSSCLCITPERMEKLDFGYPYGKEYSALIVNGKFAPEGTSASGKGGFFAGVASSFRRNVLAEKRYMILLKGLGNTMIIVLLAALLGTLLGALLCYMKMSGSRPLRTTAEVYCKILQGIPMVVLLMVMFYIVFGKSQISGISVAVISFAMTFGSSTGTIFRTAVESVGRGQMEAALSIGFTRTRAFLNIILPQAVRKALPLYSGEFVSLLKGTSVVGYITVFDLTKAGDMIRSRTFEAFFPLILVTIVYFLIIWLFSILMKYVEKNSTPKTRKF